MSEFNALTSTAAALASGGGDRVVKQSLKPLLGSNKSKDTVKRLFLNSSTSSSRHSLDRDFSILSVDDLKEIPEVGEEDNSFSLFQGFRATVPEAQVSDNSERLIAYDKDKNEITFDVINKSQSSKLLRSYQTQLNYTLDLMAIKRGTALDEVKIIDQNIDKLYILRSLLTDSIKSAEVETEQLNDLLVAIEQRMEVVNVVEEVESGETEQSLLIEEKDEAEHIPATGGHEIKFHAHDEPITCLASNTNTLVSASLDNTVRVWDISNMNSNGGAKCTGLLEGHLSIVRCMEFNNTNVATGSNDASIKLWDLTTSQPQLLQSFESHIDEITALSYTSYELVSASQDKTIRQWDVNTGKLIQTIDVLWANSIMLNSTHSISNPVLESNYTTVGGSPLPFITTIQSLSPALASGSSDGLIRLWDLRSGDVIKQFYGHQAPILSLELDQLGKLISSDTSGIVRLWDLRSGEIESVSNHQTPVINVGNTVKGYLSITPNDVLLPNNETLIQLDSISCAEIHKRRVSLGTTLGDILVHNF